MLIKVAKLKHDHQYTHTKKQMYADTFIKNICKTLIFCAECHQTVKLLTIDHGKHTNTNKQIKKLMLI